MKMQEKTKNNGIAKLINKFDIPKSDERQSGMNIVSRVSQLSLNSEKNKSKPSIGARQSTNKMDSNKPDNYQENCRTEDSVKPNHSPVSQMDSNNKKSHPPADISPASSKTKHPKSSKKLTKIIKNKFSRMSQSDKSAKGTGDIKAVVKDIDNSHEPSDNKNVETPVGESKNSVESKKSKDSSPRKKSFFKNKNKSLDYKTDSGSSTQQSPHSNKEVVLTCSTPINQPETNFQSNQKPSILTLNREMTTDSTQSPVVLNLNNDDKENDPGYPQRTYYLQGVLDADFDCATQRHSSNDFRLSGDSSLNYSTSACNYSQNRWSKSYRSEQRLHSDLNELHTLTGNLLNEIHDLRKDYNALINKQRNIKRKAERHFANLRETGTSIHTHTDHSQSFSARGSIYMRGSSNTVEPTNTAGESMLSFSQFMTDKVLTSSPSNSTID